VGWKDRSSRAHRSGARKQEFGKVRIPEQSSSQLCDAPRLRDCNYACTLVGRRRFFGALRAAALAAGMLVVGAPLAAASSTPATGSASCANTRLRPRPAVAHRIDAAILCLIDQARTAAGLQPLAANGELSGVAGQQVASMVSLDYFSDVRPSGQTPLTLISASAYPANARTVMVGEIIAWGTGADATPARIFSAWMASPGHRAIILSPGFADAGAAVTYRVPALLHAHGHGATYAVEFGARS